MGDLIFFVLNGRGDGERDVHEALDGVGEGDRSTVGEIVKKPFHAFNIALLPSNLMLIRGAYYGTFLMHSGKTQYSFLSLTLLASHQLQ